MADNNGWSKAEGAVLTLINQIGERVEDLHRKIDNMPQPGDTPLCRMQAQDIIGLKKLGQRIGWIAGACAAFGGGVGWLLSLVTGK